MPEGRFLPGGGMELGEDLASYIIRECMEETGCLANAGDLIGTAKMYMHSESVGDLHRIQAYYAGELSDRSAAPSEPDHALQ